MVCDDPWSRLPVSKLWPSSAVAVCGALSSLVTAILAPLFTVRLAGANLKLRIVTASPLAADAGLAEARGGLGEELAPPPQPASSAAAVAMATSAGWICRGITVSPFRLRRSMGVDAGGPAHVPARRCGGVRVRAQSRVGGVPSPSHPGGGR